MPPKMFCVKGFAAGNNVTPSSGSAAAAIVANNIAASKPAEHNAELPTSAIEELRKEDWINATGNGLIAGVGPHFPLWIKVPSII